MYWTNNTVTPIKELSEYKPYNTYHRILSTKFIAIHKKIMTNSKNNNNKIVKDNNKIVKDSNSKIVKDSNLNSSNKINSRRYC